MLQIPIEDSVIPQETANAKTNNNIVGHHLARRPAMPTPPDAQRVYRSPKRTFMLPQNITLQFYIHYHKNHYAT